MKRVCFVVATDATAKTSLLHQLKALSRRYRVALVANTSDFEMLKRAGIEGEVLPVPIERKVAIGKDLRALIQLYLTIRRGRFDAVHSITPKAGFLSMLAAWMCRVPIRTHTFTGQVWAARSGIRRLLLKSLDWVTAHMATHILADSPSQKAFLEAESVAPTGRVEVLGDGSICGVDLSRFRPDAEGRALVRRTLQVPSEATVFLFLGRVNRDKGLLDLMPAFVDHAGACEGTYLVVVGPDEEGLTTSLRVAAGRFEHRVRFVDFTNEPERFMAAADVLCLPSYREGFGSVVIEAAACGVPAIASRIYGIVDAIQDETTGLLHEPRNREAIARLLTRMSSDTGLRQRLARAALARAQASFSQERLTDAVVAYYSRLMA